ncbi:MAG: ribosomal protein S18-alanine N-acetyltransferase [Thaumarchaeota archaeon]|nr:ribosomal protein S18-alanine N-acetyltransferase [Nitrososphaerota archaeon]
MIEISKCGYEDIDAILEIERRSFKFPYNKQTFWYYIVTDNAGFLVARDGEKIAGYIIFSYDEAKATIVSIAVDHGYRRKGIGSMLLEAALQSLPENINNVELQVSVRNQEAVSFYSAHSFKKISSLRKYYPDGSNAIVMALTVKPTKFPRK